MDFDKEKLKFDLMDCFDESTWDKYDFEKLVNNATVDDDFIIVRGSNFKALFGRDDQELINFEIQEVEING